MDWVARTASFLLCLGIFAGTVQNASAERKIVCYYTNWSVYRPGTAKFSPQNINPYLCTHLVYAFGGFTKDNTLKPFDKYQDIEKGGYAKFTGLKTYNKNLRTMLAIGGWNEGSSRFSPMVADPERRREFVKNSVKFLRQNHFDGLDLDWEYPAFRDGGKPRDKDNYANLVQELREEFERESSKTGRPRLLLSMAMPAGIEYIDKGYDVPRLNEYLDFINLLSYDYHSAFEPAVNHHSPLYPLEEDNEYNYDTELTIDYTINYLLKKGASSEKIVLGIPTYGRSYTLFNEDSTDLGSPADGPGVEGDATREKGYLAYYEICESIADSDEWEVVQPNPNAMGPYAFKGNQWVGYDDEDIVRLKARYVNEKNLGGIMFWSIDNDDFRGKCHGRPYPLIEAAKEALLTGNSRSAEKPKADGRKKNRNQGVQNNAIGRKLVQNGRRSTTTAAPTTRKRTTSRTKYRQVSRAKAHDDEDDREVERRSYESEETDSDAGNAVRAAEKASGARTRTRTRSRSRSSGSAGRKKNARRKQESASDASEEVNLSNKLTTPEPPTTPDPGSDFKCEDEGFFPHPRDCKKYFWCLDSGPGGLGVVAHQFTCPSGLVFNKAADSCDYPRNVICPKSKTPSAASTTRAPITAATSRTTYLHSTTRRTTTAKPESEEEYEYYDEEDEADSDEEEEEEVEKEPKEEKVEKVEAPRITTTAKPLLYKTITRNRPTVTTTTTTTSTTTVRPQKSEPEKVTDSDVEEDPRVIKELIDLIKKAGGIEQLEKQLLLQEKSSGSSSADSATPATISRTLYERVLSRQAGKLAGNTRQTTSGKTGHENAPGRAHFEGLDELPEVKSLRRSNRPQYVTIERPKSSTKEPPVEDEEAEEDGEVDEDDPDVDTSEEQTANGPLQTSSSTQRVAPNYVNIRRNRPATTTSKNENDVGEKDEEIESKRPVRRRRPASSKSEDNESNSESSKPSRRRFSIFRNAEKPDDTPESEVSDEESPVKKSRIAEVEADTPTTKSRYINIQRFRSTTPTGPGDDESNIVLETTTDTASAKNRGELASAIFSSTTAPTSTEPSSTVVSTSTVSEDAPPPSSSSPASSETSATFAGTPSSTSMHPVTTSPISRDAPYSGRTSSPITSGTSPSDASGTSSSVSSGTSKLDYPGTSSSDAPGTSSVSAGTTLSDASGTFSSVSSGTSSSVSSGTSSSVSSGTSSSISSGTSSSNSTPAPDTFSSADATSIFAETASTTDSVRLVEDSATEILLTTAPASQPGPGSPLTRLAVASVSQPRPFGFARRGRPVAGQPDATTPLPTPRSKVAGPEAPRLPTLKELVAYRPADSTTAPSLVPFNSLQEQKDFLNLSLEEEELKYEPNDGINNDLAKEETLNYSESRKNVARPGSLSELEEDRRDNDVGYDFSRNKRGRTARIEHDTSGDRSSLIEVKPTTMRGVPIVTFASERPLRGFYVTRGEVDTPTTVQAVENHSEFSRATPLAPGYENRTVGSVESDPVATFVTTERFPATTVAFDHHDAPLGVGLDVTTIESVVVETTLDANLAERKTEVGLDDTTSGIRKDETTLEYSQFDTLSLSDGTEEGSRNITDVRTAGTMGIGAAEPAEQITRNETVDASLDDNISTTSSNERAAETGLPETITNADDRGTTLVMKLAETTTEILPLTTLSSVSTSTPKIGQVVRKGVRHRATNKSQSFGVEQPKVTDLRPRRVTVLRGRRRKPNLATTTVEPRRTSDNSTETGDQEKKERRMKVVVRKLKMKPDEDRVKHETEKIESEGSSVKPKEDQAKLEVEEIESEASSIKPEESRPAFEEDRIESETDRVESEGQRTADETSVKEDGTSAAPKPRDPPARSPEEDTDRPASEVSLSKNSATRKPGTLLSNRSRKPQSSFSTTPSSTGRLPSTFAGYRKTRPGETTPSSRPEKEETTEGTTEASKRVDGEQKTESADQSSRAQELAVTLADPPSAQASSGTGRPTLRDASRRRISTTIAPRAETTASPTTSRATTVLGGRQRSRYKVTRGPENASARPRRPPVRDYDYYEDEEEPVVAKSAFKGKLFLTSRGAIRCLDQGNFPHPFSCRKFITCARMVNGEVVGAEYTCPNKLSFDPVGGICNWSAGLGCKE